MSVSRQDEQAIVDVATELKHQGYVVELHPKMGTFQPDLIVRQADGAVLVIEITDRIPDVHKLAYLDAVRDWLQKGEGSVARAMLLTREAPDQDVQSMATRLNLDIVKVDWRRSVTDAVSKVKLELLDRVMPSTDTGALPH